MFSYIFSDLSLLFSTNTDSCLVNNGGCDVNAICSHHPTTNACRCTCKTGYTNTDSTTNVICTGRNTYFKSIVKSFVLYIHLPMFIDSCLVNNGGCNTNAICSHDTATNECRCTCKTGYTNTGTANNVTCTGGHLFFDQ